jgi:hypothetical protein
MRQLLTKLRPLVVAGGTAAVGELRKRIGDLRSDDSANRLTALEKGFEIQSELNTAMDVQITVLQVQLVKLRKTVQFLLIALIATATIAAIALAAALMR